MKPLFLSRDSVSQGAEISDETELVVGEDDVEERRTLHALAAGGRTTYTAYILAAMPRSVF